jgi:hypothetical protein
VFPAVQEAGFVPVTADDIVTPGDSVSAKIDMLIDRSSVMVVEITSTWTRAEYRMALARIKEAHTVPAQRKQLRLIVVTTESEQVSRAETDGIRVILRPNIVSGDPETFVQELADALRMLGGEVGGSRRAEPERLVEAKEYRAAVISAMSLLEARLRERLNKSPWPQVRNPMSMHSLLKIAREQQLLTDPNDRSVKRPRRQCSAQRSTPSHTPARFGGTLSSLPTMRKRFSRCCTMRSLLLPVNGSGRYLCAGSIRTRGRSGSSGEPEGCTHTLGESTRGLTYIMVTLLPHSFPGCWLSTGIKHAQRTSIGPSIGTSVPAASHRALTAASSCCKRHSSCSPGNTSSWTGTRRHRSSFSRHQRAIACVCCFRLVEFPSTSRQSSRTLRA